MLAFDPRFKVKSAPAVADPFANVCTLAFDSRFKVKSAPAVADPFANVCTLDEGLNTAPPCPLCSDTTCFCFAPPPSLVALQVITTLFCLKLQHPNRVFLVRGNHEDSDVNEHFGFKTECWLTLSPSG
jgi:hypothetical protein